MGEDQSSWEIKCKLVQIEWRFKRENFESNSTNWILIQLSRCSENHLYLPANISGGWRANELDSRSTTTTVRHELQSERIVQKSFLQRWADSNHSFRFCRIQPERNHQTNVSENKLINRRIKVNFKVKSVHNHRLQLDRMEFAWISINFTRKSTNFDPAESRGYDMCEQFEFFHDEIRNLILLRFPRRGFASKMA